MSPDFHGILLLVIPTVTAILCFTLRDAPSRGRVLWSLILILVLFVVVPSCYTHLCTRGNPWSQVVIPSLCIGALAMFVRRLDVAVLASLSIGFLMVVMCNSYIDLVHSDRFTGNPSSRAHEAAQEHLRDSTVRFLKKLSASDDVEHPPSWVADAAFIKNPEELSDRTYRVESRFFWHSRLTQLYGEEKFRVELWYPGGKLADAADKLEFRDRPK